MIGVLRMAEDAVRFRDTEKGRAQSEVLRSFESDCGRKRSVIVAELTEAIDVQHDQYRRYLRGDTPLKWDQIGAFARAFRVTTAALTQALGLMDDAAITATAEPPDDPTWNFLEELRRAWPDDPEAVEATYRRLGGAPQSIQRAVIDAIREADDDAPQLQCTVSEERAHFGLTRTG